jgi:glycosyltransferase involved in cell wall biosynthesis
MKPETKREQANAPARARSAVFVLFYPDFIPRHRLMARALAAAGWTVRVVSWNRDWPKQAPAAEEWLSGRQAIPLPAGTASAALLLRLPRLFLGVLRALRGEPPADALFLTHFALLPLAPLLRRRCGALFYDAPDYFCEDLLRYFGPLAGPMRPLLRLFERAFVSAVDAVLTIDSHAGWLADYYRRMRRPVLVLWNVPALADDPAAAEIAAAAAGLGGGPIAAYVGGLKPDKGLAAMLAAIGPIRERFPEARFLFIGGAPDAALRRLQAEGAALVMESMPYRGMMACLRNADIGLALLQKGRNDLAGAGNCRKVFSYMQGGLPVVVTAVGSVGEFVREQNCGTVVDPEQPGQAVQAIGRYLADPALARAHGENGRRAFAARFNWEAQSAAFTGFVAATVRA